MYDFSRVFLLENNPYRRVASAFNGKPGRTEILEIMTLTDWIRAYDREKEKESVEMFNSNGEPMFDDPEFFMRVEKIPVGMKNKYVFYDIPY